MADRTRHRLPALRRGGQHRRDRQFRRGPRLAGGAEGSQRRIRRPRRLGVQHGARGSRRAGAGRLPRARADSRAACRVHPRACRTGRAFAGQGAAYPVAATVQRDGICHEVLAPAPGLPAGRQAEAQRLALAIAAELGVTGLMAVELFDTADSLLVNELAMRPHNSGHWTMDGSVTSQFEQHLRAVLNLPLGVPDLTGRHAVMVNVLGGDDPDLHDRLTHVMAADPGARVHLYGKVVRPGRKVGHVTVVGDDTGRLLDRARRAASYLSLGTEEP